MNKLSFSGHESFSCKHFWLKKGVDFVQKELKFSDDIAVVELGVGKNMVASIRYWLRAFGLTDDNDNLKKIAEYIFGEEGRDLYLEDYGTLWLLHYLLVSSEKASIYSLIFNGLRKERFEFTKEQIDSFLKRACEENQSNPYNKNTIQTDINVFQKTYLSPMRDKVIDKEDFSSGALTDLNLIRLEKHRASDGTPKEVYRIESQDRNQLPFHIFLFSILDHADFSLKASISFHELQVAHNSPGLIFAMTPDGILNKIKEMESAYSGIVYTETAGNRVVHFKKKPEKWKVLGDYYGQ